MKALYDADYLTYSCSYVCEQRFSEYDGVRYNNRSEIKNKFIDEYGDEEGIIKYNEIKDDIITIQQQTGSIKKATGIVNQSIKNINKKVKASSYRMYLEGNKDDGALPLFRWEQSQLLEYKGNRKDLLRPLLKDEVKKHILKNHPSFLCLDGYESDDHVIMESYKLSKSKVRNIVITPDKDAMGCPVEVWNPDKREYRNGACFGRVYKEGEMDRYKVRGYGRLWLYTQVLSGDSIDNYKANCFSNKRWGDVSAYKKLHGCKNDKEAFEVMVECFKYLYPEPKETVGWRGNTINIDWLSVMEEMWMLARMKRWKGDNITIKEVLNNMKIDYR